MTEDRLHLDLHEPDGLYQTLQRPLTKSFKVSGIYSTLLGRQDLNYTSPVHAKYIRKRDRNDKDVNLYKIYHTRNLDHIEEIKRKQLKLKQQEIDATLQHQRLLDQIKQKAAEKRNRIRNRSSKPFPTLPTNTEFELDQNIDNDGIQSENVKLYDDPKLQGYDNMLTKSNTNMDIAKLTHSKPKWALTAEQNDLEMDNEVDELLDFVNTLEIDDYLENLELQEKLASIQGKIENFKKQQKEMESTKIRIEWDEQNIIDKENIITNKENNENIRKNSAKINTLTQNVLKNVQETMNTLQSEEICTSQIADEILNASENIKNIHSKQSIKSILDNTKGNQYKPASNEMCTPNSIKPVEFIEHSKNKYNEPRISVIRERLPPVRERQNLNENDINKLPYLYRHPGV